MLCDAMKELLKCLETVVNSELKNVYDRFNANRLTINKLRFYLFRNDPNQDLGWVPIKSYRI